MQSEWTEEKIHPDTEKSLWKSRTIQEALHSIYSITCKQRHAWNSVCTFADFALLHSLSAWHDCCSSWDHLQLTFWSYIQKAAVHLNTNWLTNWITLLEMGKSGSLETEPPVLWVISLNTEWLGSSTSGCAGMVLSLNSTAVRQVISINQETMSQFSCWY